MKMTIGEFIKLWADGTHPDVDVTENVSESFCIAYCGTQLTEAGEKEWDDVLKYTIDVDEDPRWPVAVVDMEDASDEEIDRVRSFFYAMAGYCAESYYDLWFED